MTNKLKNIEQNIATTAVISTKQEITHATLQPKQNFNTTFMQLSSINWYRKYILYLER